jgi:hypothetical protein
LSLASTNFGPIGLEGLYHAPLAFKANSMPLLKSLKLEYVFIDPPLVRFLVHHASVLEQVTFVNCMASVQGLEENGIHCEDLFTPLAKAKPRKLSQFEVFPLEVPCELDRMEELKKLEENKSKRVFQYDT